MKMSKMGIIIININSSLMKMPMKISIRTIKMIVKKMILLVKIKKKMIMVIIIIVIVILMKIERI
jgi:hypothetical protein